MHNDRVAVGERKTLLLRNGARYQGGGLGSTILDSTARLPAAAE